MIRGTTSLVVCFSPWKLKIAPTLKSLLGEQRPVSPRLIQHFFLCSLNINCCCSIKCCPRNWELMSSGNTTSWNENEWWVELYFPWRRQEGILHHCNIQEMCSEVGQAISVTLADATLTDPGPATQRQYVLWQRMQLYIVLLFICIAPLVCIVFYSEQTIRQVSTRKSLQSKIQPREGSGYIGKKRGEEYAAESVQVVFFCAWRTRWRPFCRSSSVPFSKGCWHRLT